MKHLSILSFIPILFFFSSCKDDDLSWKNEIERIRVELTNQKILIEGLKQNVYITGIETKDDYNNILFSNGMVIRLENGRTPVISITDDGFWSIDGVVTNCKAEGKTPTVSINEDGFWVINGIVSDFKAKGLDGKDGKDAPLIKSVVQADNILTFNFSDGTSIPCLFENTKIGSDGLEELSDNPLAHISYYPGFCSIIKSWGFIGDSFSSGTVEFDDEESGWIGVDKYEYSWGQCICRLTGSSGTNFSKGGQWTTGWLIGPAQNKTWDLAKDSPKQAYIIALGYNDLYTYVGHIEKGDISTDVNLADYTKNANTYAGNMAGIIQRIKSINKNAICFVVTLPNEPSKAEFKTDEWNDVIRELPNLFEDTYVIDLYKYAPVYDDEFKKQYFEGVIHMSAAGYQYTAYMFMTYIDWIIRKNPSAFTKIVIKDFE